MVEIASAGQRAGVGLDLAGLGGNILNLGQQTARGDFLDPNSNPFLKDTINFALQPAVSQFQNSVLPALRIRSFL